MEKTETKTALISVFHKEGIEDFAKELVDMGWRISSSLREFGASKTRYK